MGASSTRRKCNRTGSSGYIRPANIQSEIGLLLDNGISANTRAVYESAITVFTRFKLENGHEDIWPPSLTTLTEFIAFMSLKGFAPSTARSYMSGISFCCKIKNVTEPTNNFIISKLFNGFHRLHKRIDTRLPITYDILRSIVGALPAICYSSFEAQLFKAIFSLAFFGFFRIGELVVSNLNCDGHALLINDVHIEGLSALKIALRSSKTDQQGKGVVLYIPQIGTESCPVHNVREYLKLRKRNDCQSFFCHSNNLPVTRYQFASVLKKTLSTLGINSNQYKSHSFALGQLPVLQKTGSKMRIFNYLVVGSQVHTSRTLEFQHVC